MVDPRACQFLLRLTIFSLRHPRSPGAPPEPPRPRGDQGRSSRGSSPSTPASPRAPRPASVPRPPLSQNTSSHLIASPKPQLRNPRSASPLSPHSPPPNLRDLDGIEDDLLADLLNPHILLQPYSSPPILRPSSDPKSFSVIGTLSPCSLSASPAFITPPEPPRTRGDQGR
jgi:hypothetical protein